MQLFHSPTSPFVRKVMVAAHELGLADRLELLPSAPHPVHRDGAVLTCQPLAQVPTLIDEAGDVVADSRVICDYLDALGGGRLHPPQGQDRWRALNEQSAADGLLDAALLIRYERTVRPEAERSAAWIDGQGAKVDTVLAWFEGRAAGLRDRVDIGTIALACALSYLDLRFPERDWRTTHPALAAWYTAFEDRPSMRATRPPAA